MKHFSKALPESPINGVGSGPSPCNHIDQRDDYMVKKKISAFPHIIVRNKAIVLHINQGPIAGGIGEMIEFAHHYTGDESESG